MKFLSVLFASAVVAASAGIASATTINLASYGSATGTAVPAGVGNTALRYQGGLVFGFLPVSAGSGMTYDVSSNGVWTKAVGNSSWVAQNAGDGPNGGHTELDGIYYFSTTFVDSDAADSTGTITVMADDTTGVFLNGHQIAAAASSATSGTCDSSTPNCTVPATYTLLTSDFINGTNTLVFDVMQEHEAATGLDFSGTVNVASAASVTPEPNSLLLLGTGLAMVAGFAFHRRQVQA